MNKSQKEGYIYVVIILLLIAVIFSALFRAHENYSEYREQKDYLASSEKQIQAWMSIKTISTWFNLSFEEIFEEAGLNKTKINPHMSLKKFCNEYNQNCPLLMEKLNNRTRT